jgi:hypothetical protein
MIAVIWAFMSYYRARYDRSPESIALITEYSIFEQDEAMSRQEIGSLETIAYSTPDTETDI